jgi:hypothetical protein
VAKNLSDIQSNFNDPESRGLTPEETLLFEAAREAIGFLKKTFPTWIVIGHAVVAARKRADQLGGGKTFRIILEQQGISKIVPSSTATRLIAIIEHLPEVKEWHASLTDDRQFAWAAPTSIFQHCPVFDELKKTMKEKKKKKPQTSMAPSSPHNARVIEQQSARIEELQEELESKSNPSNWVAAYKDKSSEERAEAICDLLFEFEISLELLKRTYKTRREKKKSRAIEDREAEVVELSIDNLSSEEDQP